MNIYVGNLSNEVTEDILRQTFEAFGAVASANIIKDRFSGESRGFGFVEMADKQEALAAIQQADGKELSGKAIRVNEARTPHKASGPRRQSGGGGRRGGFGGARGGRSGGFGDRDGGRRY